MPAFFSDDKHSFIEYGLLNACLKVLNCGLLILKFVTVPKKPKPDHFFVGRSPNSFIYNRKNLSISKKTLTLTLTAQTTLR